MVGGQTSLGPVGQVGVLWSPAVLTALQLQEESLQQHEVHLKCQQQELQLHAQLHLCAAQAQEAQAAIEVG